MCVCEGVSVSVRVSVSVCGSVCVWVGERVCAGGRVRGWGGEWEVVKRGGRRDAGKRVVMGGASGAGSLFALPKG